MHPKHGEFMRDQHETMKNVDLGIRNEDLTMKNVDSTMKNVVLTLSTHEKYGFKPPKCGSNHEKLEFNLN